MDEEEQGGISIGDIFRTIFSQKWLALIITVAVTVVGILGINFVYNPRAAVYQVSFSLNLPGISGTATYYSLPGGDRFYFTDYASTTVLEKVKASDEQFSSLDIDKMVEKNDIVFTETYTSVESESENDSASVMSIRRTFTLAIVQKYFKDKDVAKAFLTALTQYPVKLYLDAVESVNYNVYLDEEDFINAVSFGTQIGYIEAQINYISSLYDNLASVVVDDEGTQLKYIQQRFSAWISQLQSDLSSLSADANANYYIKDYDKTISYYRNELVNLYKELEDAQRNLNNIQQYLIDNQVTGDGVAQVINNLVSNVTSIQRSISNRLELIGAYYDYSIETDADGNKRVTLVGEAKQSQIEATNAYAAAIREIYDDVVEMGGFIDGYVELNKVIYEKISSVTYTLPNAIESDGGFSILISVVISLVVGLILACIVAYIVAVVKRNKAAQEVPAVTASETQAQAAVTDADETKKD